MVTTEVGMQELIALRGTSPPPVVEVRPTLTAVTGETYNPVAEKTCGWSIFCEVIGWMNLLLGVIGLLMLGGGSSDRANGIVLTITGFAGGLSSFIFGYIIQLLFDCRRYLRRLAER